MITMSRVTRVFGDRILIRRLERPEKVGKFFIPANYAKEKTGEQELWWGVIEHFGLDSRYGNAYGLKTGDIVGVDSIGQHSAAFDGDDGEIHCWVAEEFVTCKDTGLVKAYRDGKVFKGANGGLQPLGPYSLVQVHAEETKRGGIMLPDSAKSATRTGTILAVSSGYMQGGAINPLPIVKGTDVLLGKYSGARVKLGPDTSLVVVKAEDVIAEYDPACEPMAAKA